MVSLLQIAQMIEQGLTAQLDDPNIDFKVWANAGELSKSLRTANTVQSYIQGTLRSSSSSNEANILSMGYNGLTLDLSVPLQAPKTLSTQTAQDLQRISDSQYPFISLIASTIDAYFSIANVFQLTDENGTQYTISMQAGRAITGNVDIAATLGNNLIITVFIGLYFLEGGVSARNVILTIDGVRVPLSSVTIGRANRMTNDVYQNSTTVKNMSSATALSIDFAFPANSDNTTSQAFLSLLDGQPNVAHFVELSIGTQYDGHYLMMFDNLNIAAQGVQFAGVTGSLVEVIGDAQFINVPDYIQVGRFTYDNTYSAQSLGFIAPAKIWCAGQFEDGTAGGTIGISLMPSDYVYSQTNAKYYVYMFSLGAVTVSDASAPFSIVKEATENAPNE